MPVPMRAIATPPGSRPGGTGGFLSWARALPPSAAAAMRKRNEARSRISRLRGRIGRNSRGPGGQADRSGDEVGKGGNVVEGEHRTAASFGGMVGGDGNDVRIRVGKRLMAR